MAEIGPGLALRDFTSADADVLDAVAIAAFEPMLAHYADPAAMRRRISRMSRLAADGEIILATVQDKIAGAIAYVPAGRPKAEFFAPEWPIVRMLVVDPLFRGRGLGRALTEACLARARRDGAAVIALHTSPVMAEALGLYLRMGFRRHAEAPSIFGVPYAVYLKDLRDPSGA
jgi:ribosomal protein S18 acetylase RimI-like enzyme